MDYLADGGAALRFSPKTTCENRYEDQAGVAHFQTISVMRELSAMWTPANPATAVLAVGGSKESARPQGHQHHERAAGTDPRLRPGTADRQSRDRTDRARHAPAGASSRLEPRPDVDVRADPEPQAEAGTGASSVKILTRC